MRLVRTLGISGKEQIAIRKMGADEFMRTEMKIDSLNRYFPEGEDVFEEVK